MPQIFVALDKIKPAYDITYRVVLVLCKILLVADILITSMAVAGRYCSATRFLRNRDKKNEKNEGKYLK